MSRTAVLAYSGGLDTTCAIAWLREDYGFDEVIAVLVDVGQTFDIDQAIERGRAAGAADVILLDRQELVRGRPGREGPQGECSLRGEVPARLGAVAPRHRRGGRVARARARRRGGRARLHRQGQRPASLRACVQGQLPRRERDRPAPRPHLVARGGDRVRARTRYPGKRHHGSRPTRSTRTSWAGRSRPACSRTRGRPRRRSRTS